MPVEHGDAHTGGGHADIRVLHNFGGFQNHLHLFLGVFVVQKDVDVRQAVEGDAMGIGLDFRFTAVEQMAHLAFQLGDALLARAAYGLVSGHHHAPNNGGGVQRLQGHHHLNGGAIGIGDDAVVFLQSVGIHLGHHQRATLVHTPGAGVVHHHAARSHGMGCIFQRGGATRRKQGQVHAPEGFPGHFLHHQFVIPVGHLVAGRTRRRKRHHRSGGKIPLGQNVQHFAPDGACGARDGHDQRIAHNDLL